MMQLSEIRSKISSIETALTLRSQTLSDLQNRLAGLETEALDLDLALSLCQKCLEEQVDLRQYVEGIVTAFLQKTFNNPEMYFIYEVSYKSDGLTVAGVTPKVFKDGILKQPQGHGGGCGCLTGLAIRICFLLLMPWLEPIIFIDEPLVNLDAEKWNLVVQFLEDLGLIQLIIITHSGARLSKTYRVHMSGSISRVTEVINE